MKNKRAQLTLFIILGLIIIAGIAFFFINPGIISSSESAIRNPQGYLDKCLKDSMQEAEDLILKNNGYAKIEDNFMIYNQEKIPFLCTNYEFYMPCIPQEPAFLNSVQKIIENRVSIEAEKCLSNFAEELRAGGYSVSITNGSVELTIRQGEIMAQIKKSVYFSKGEETTEISTFETSYQSNLFDMIKLIQNIVNYESTLCEFDLNNWQLYENKIAVTRFRTSDQTKIYTLRDRITNKELKFAIRTCVMPAGL